MGVLPGEGIGPEVIGAALGVLDAVDAAAPLGIRRVEAGAAAREADKDGSLGEGVAAFCQGVFDDGGMIFCGPHRGRFVYDLRRRFDLFCKLVPLKPSAVLRQAGRFKAGVLDDVDILLVRDNAGGVYQGSWTLGEDGADGRQAEHRFSYSEGQVRRIVEVAVRMARSRRGRLHVAVKEGGVPSVSGLWRRCAEELAGAAGVECTVLNADYAAYGLIQHPRDYDVMVAPNMLGDILGDVGAALLGSRGLSYSANFSADGLAVYQTAHGAADDLAGSDRANPVAQILSLAMMLRESYGLARPARWIEEGVEDVWRAGWRTDDIAEPGCRPAGTRLMGELIGRAAGRRGKDAGVT
jgi:3-isopropylmalate dehydrogenase